MMFIPWTAPCCLFLRFDVVLEMILGFRGREVAGRVPS